MTKPEDPSAIVTPTAATEASRELQLPSPTTPASLSGANRAPAKRKNHEALPDQVLCRPGAAIVAEDAGQIRAVRGLYRGMLKEGRIEHARKNQTLEMMPDVEYIPYAL